MMGIDTLAIHCLKSEILFHFTPNERMWNVINIWVAC